MKDEYIRKQDAIDAIHCDIKITGRENAETVCKTIESFTDGIKSLEPADVVPVVRCRNCEHWQTDWNPSIPDRHYCAVMDSMMKAEDFCSYGERREG